MRPLLLNPSSRCSLSANTSSPCLSRLKVGLLLSREGMFMVSLRLGLEKLLPLSYQVSCTSWISQESTKVMGPSSWSWLQPENLPCKSTNKPKSSEEQWVWALLVFMVEYLEDHREQCCNEVLILSLQHLGDLSTSLRVASLTSRDALTLYLMRLTGCL